MTAIVSGTGGRTHLPLTSEGTLPNSEPIGSQRRRRILIVAYACIPDRGSEPGVGWNRAVEAAKYFDTWVLCRESLCAKGIAEYIERHGAIPGLHFVFVPESPLEQFLDRIPKGEYLVYRLWNKRVARLAQSLHDQYRFSLLHQLTLCSFREPGYLWQLDAPFVWGPIGGAQNYPWRFLMKAGLSVAIREGIRSVMNELQLRYSPRVRRAARRAALLMAATTVNYRALTRAHAVKPVLFIDGGVCQRSPGPSMSRTDGVLRILWCGMLEARKALHLLIEALGQVSHDVLWELHVVGSGSLRAKWERLARTWGVADRIQWLGSVSHQESLAQFAWSNVFVFTSLRDTSGIVLFEAMAAGKPIVCLDHQGSGDVVDSSCGIKIPVTRPRDVVNALARSIELLSRNRQMRDGLAHGALQRVQQYLWSDQGERLAKLYSQVITANDPTNNDSHAAFGQEDDINAPSRLSHCSTASGEVK